MLPVVLLNAITTEIDYVGCITPADGYYGEPNNLHTISVYLQNFSGILIIEASLANQPTETDWFAIDILGDNSLQIQYPQAGDPPTGQSGASGVRGYNFRINALWLRAKVIRSYYLSPTSTPDIIAAAGSIQKILLSF
jgi:hypothetical protein